MNIFARFVRSVYYEYFDVHSGIWHTNRMNCMSFQQQSV